LKKINYHIIKKMASTVDILDPEKLTRTEQINALKSLLEDKSADVVFLTEKVKKLEQVIKSKDDQIINLNKQIDNLIIMCQHVVRR